MTTKIYIRAEKVEDYSDVYEVNRLAFGQKGEADLVDSLRKNIEVFISELSLVAANETEIVGHILFTKIKIDNVSEQFESLALAPMAVKNEFQNQGIGAKLVNEGLRKATELGYKSVIVLGHEHYYPKFGFVPAEKWNIKASFEVPQSNFMAIELVENGLKNVQGTVIYPKEFETV